VPVERLPGLWQMGASMQRLHEVEERAQAERAGAEAPSRAPLRSTVELVLGAVALAVGVGYGGPHLVKTGLTLRSVVGVFVLVGGLVLFASGLRRLFRSSPWWARFPARAGVVVLALLLCLTLGQAVAATNVPRPELGSRTPADAGLRYRDVEFDATDGVTLSGWYVPSTNGAAVVLLHGAGSTRSNVLDHAVVLARHGYGVLLFDARGHGRSDGRAMDFGWFGDRDIGGAVAFLQQQADVDAERIGAVGMSMGGEQAIGASAGIDAIRAVVAEGATNRVAGDKAWLSDEFGVRGAISEAIEAMTYGFTDLLTSARPPITLHDAVRASTRPTLLIAAGDVADEARAGRHIASGSPGTVELWVVPDTGHTDAVRTQPEEWEARVATFLDDALGLGATTGPP
jgi:pimeloyl-ACP methyl ester carboxylesterase